MVDFAELDLVFSVLAEGCGWKEQLQRDMFGVEWDQMQSVSQLIHARVTRYRQAWGQVVCGSFAHCVPM